MDQNVSSHGFEYGVKHFFSTKSGNLCAQVEDTLGLKSREVFELLQMGAIYLENQRQNENALISENQLIRVHTKPRRFYCNFNWLEHIVFENRDFLVLNKPSGLPSHPSVDNKIENSLYQTSLARQIPLFITHRLDTLTEGLIVYGKNQAFVKDFNQQLNQRLIEKKYVALVDSKQPLTGRLTHYMQPSPRAPKNVSPIYQPDWLLCELEILSQKDYLGGSWVKINLLTGRTHQIRGQLSEIKAPIYGDHLYGSNITWPPQGSTPAERQQIALRACELQFNWNSQRLLFNLDEKFN